MENAPVITGLLDKRASIESEIAELERQIRRHRSEVMQIDATILLFAPNLRRAKRDVSRFQRSAHFMTGELTRRCRTAFREAKGCPVTADEIAVRAMQEKNLDMGDGGATAGHHAAVHVDVDADAEDWGRHQAGVRMRGGGCR
jgi:multidrug resistance efflux pump